MVYEVWVAGKLGLHKDKPVLMAVLRSRVDAERTMISALTSGECAFIVDRHIEKQEKLNVR